MMSNAQAAMGSNGPTLSFEVNMLTKLWCTITTNQFFCHAFLEYIKLVKITIVHVLNLVEDKWCFSPLSFLKNKLQNALDPHLQLVMGMYIQKIYI
jgi:hypothetical protein